MKIAEGNKAAQNHPKGWATRLNMNKYIIKVIMIVFLLFYCVSGTEEAIDTPKKALDTALNITNFTNSKEVKKNISLSKNVCRVIFSDSTVPVVSKIYNGSEVWRVTLKNIKFDSKGWTTKVSDNQLNKNVEIYIDPISGKTIKIVATCVDCEEYLLNLRQDFSLDSIERRLKASHEIYHEIPENIPQISFSQALTIAVPSSPLIAKKIIGYHIIHSGIGNEKRHVWCIIGRGIPTLLKNVDSQRTILDANTGELLFSTNYP